MRLPGLGLKQDVSDWLKMAGNDRAALIDICRKAPLYDPAQGEGSSASRKDDKPVQGRALVLADPEPWPVAVDGAQLLDALVADLRAYVVMSPEQAHAVALWVVHSHAVEASLITPRLGIRSPVLGCGKTTLLDWLARVVRRPLPAANVSAPAVFRVVEATRPCLLIDEADSFLPGNE